MKKMLFILVALMTVANTQAADIVKVFDGGSANCSANNQYQRSFKVTLKDVQENDEGTKVSVKVGFFKCLVTDSVLTLEPIAFGDTLTYIAPFSKLGNVEVATRIESLTSTLFTEQGELISKGEVSVLDDGTLGVTYFVKKADKRKKIVLGSVAIQSTVVKALNYNQLDELFGGTYFLTL